jgi:beta-glucanase (GH16 family)
MTYHWGSSQSPQKNESILSNLPDPEGWHTYAVNWQPGHIDWYIDGVLRKSITGRQVTGTPMEVIANLAVGGTLPGYPDSSTRFPANMQIAFVRVYQLQK